MPTGCGRHGACLEQSTYLTDRVGAFVAPGLPHGVDVGEMRKQDSYADLDAAETRWSRCSGRRVVRTPRP
ncbi:MAG TPA: hypothetical protein VMQ78_10805 [Candidatus Limnocylindria bacterium]|nr:hypothetical protein [Candidatus Limnocylindria bacterium]